MDYVLGCDVGSQSAKAILLTAAGSLAAEAAEDYAVDYPAPLWAEQPAERWLSALARAVRRALHAAQAPAASVRALAVAAQVDGIVPVDGAGQPLRPALIWMDRRAGPQCAQAEQAMDAGRLFARTGLNLDPTHVAPKIRWIADNEPHVDAQTAHYLLPGSFVARWLCGELAVDYSNASSTLLLDVVERRWAPDLCAAFGVDPARLAPVCAAATVLGPLRPAAAEALGLTPATLVLAGCGDEHAACLGAGILAPGRVGDIAGTAEPVCAALPAPRFDDTRLLETHCHADPGQWLLENPGFVSGGNFRWYRDHFGQAEINAALGTPQTAYARLDAQAAAVPPGSDGLVFLPCLMGAMAPTWDPEMRGAWLGFTLAHTRAHFARAVLEGSAYAVRDIVDRLRAMRLDVSELRVMGGGARSPLWNQIKADVCGLPVLVPAIHETTALGAALLALVGLGRFASLAEAAEQLVQLDQRFEPDPARQRAYHAPYQRYRQAYFALQPVFAAAGAAAA